VKGKDAGLDFWGTSYILMEPYLRNFEKYFQDMEADLSKGGLRITYRAYVAGMMLASTIGFIAGGAVGYLIVFSLNLSLLIQVLMPLGFGLLCGTSTFSIFYVLPRLKARSRQRKLDAELSYAVGHMAVLASAGLTPEKMFHSLAEEDTKDVVNQEAKMIVRDMSLLGMDLEHAMKAEQKRSPSERFIEFLDGFASASKTGGDLKTYLLRAASSMMLDKRLRARAISESIGLVAEMYTIVLVVTPLLLLIMFAVIGVVVGSIGGFSVLTLIYFVMYAMVPLGGIMVLVIADSTVSAEVT
jgi:flagellar protein FlaJ